MQVDPLPPDPLPPFVPPADPEPVDPLVPELEPTEPPTSSPQPPKEVAFMLDGEKTVGVIVQYQAGDSVCIEHYVDGVPQRTWTRGVDLLEV